MNPLPLPSNVRSVYKKKGNHAMQHEVNTRKAVSRDDNKKMSHNHNDSINNLLGVTPVLV